MERNRRSSFQGTVVSCRNSKTIVVEVSTKRNDPLYNKRVGYSKKYYAHDEKEEAKVGDIVTIMACRPLSKTKRFRLVAIVQRANEVTTAQEVETALEAQEGVNEVVETGSVKEETSENAEGDKQ